MEISVDSGIVIQNNSHRLILDPHRKIRKCDDTLVCVSHAHSDHVRRHDVEVLSTPETADLFPYQLKSVPVKYNKKHEFDGMSIKQKNANHILGSSQFEITTDEQRIVYTGDFRLNESFLFGKCDVPECDTLIIESTYGMPHFKFPEMNKVREDVEKWVKINSRQGKNLVFGSYSLGKSQEIISILNEMGIVPVVHPKIAEFSRIYNKHGHSLAFLESGTEDGNKTLSNRFAAVMPQNLIDSSFLSSMQGVTGCKIAAALLTGWGTLYNFSSRGIEKVFIMSDHADFYQIMNYIKQSKAKEVFTVHGYQKELAKHIQARVGINARPLKKQ